MLMTIVHFEFINCFQGREFYIIQASNLPQKIYNQLKAHPAANALFHNFGYVFLTLTIYFAICNSGTISKIFFKNLN